MTFSFDGMQVNYEVEGDGQNVLLLHGWGASVDSIRPIFNLLTPHFRVLMPDLPGCGKTDEPKRPYDLPDYSALVTALCRKEKMDHLIVLGHSNGGLVTLRLNEEGNLHIVKNILVDAKGVKSPKSLKTRLKIASFKVAKFFLLCPLWKKWGEKKVAERREKYASEDYKNASAVMRPTMSNLLKWDMSGVLGDISVPTLLVWGENDTATPLSMAKQMEKLLPDAGLVVLKGAGHFSYLDCSAQFNAVLKSFLEF